VYLLDIGIVICCMNLLRLVRICCSESFNFVTYARTEGIDRLVLLCMFQTDLISSVLRSVRRTAAMSHSVIFNMTCGGQRSFFIQDRLKK